jgi:hypothetical protein
MRGGLFIILVTTLANCYFMLPRRQSTNSSEHMTGYLAIRPASNIITSLQWLLSATCHHHFHTAEAESTAEEEAESTAEEEVGTAEEEDSTAEEEVGSAEEDSTAEEEEEDSTAEEEDSTAEVGPQ